MSAESINWEAIINFVLLAMLIVITIGIVRVRNLFAVVMLASIFSLIMASVFTLLDAVDVAFTEAAVGAGISTILALGTLALIDNRNEKIPDRFRWTPLIVSAATGAILIWAMEGLPEVGDPNAPAQLHVGPDYIARTPVEIDVPNIVTAVLASYRGFDTLGEVTVIFTAGIGVMYLLSSMPVIGGRRQRRKRRDGSDEA
jgi:multicomponent Na+:H+ antiporter subunit B